MAQINIGKRLIRVCVVRLSIFSSELAVHNYGKKKKTDEFDQAFKG